MPRQKQSKPKALKREYFPLKPSYTFILCMSMSQQVHRGPFGNEFVASAGESCHVFVKKPGCILGKYLSWIRVGVPSLAIATFPS